MTEQVWIDPDVVPYYQALADAIDAAGFRSRVVVLLRAADWSVPFRLPVE